jgi:hypothetical protein
MSGTRVLRLSLGLLLAATTLAAGLGVDVDELKTAKKVEFVNYTGPVDMFQTDFDIRGIGRALARQIAAGRAAAGFEVKYTAIHAVDTAEPGKLSADIIVLEKDAKIDTIDNVRRVISAYLAGLYRYPRRDADLLALFVSYYNAVYRGSLPYFMSKYKTVVTSHLDVEKVGISTKYFDWPGKTQMVIPLNEAATRDIFGALDSSALTDKKVIEQLRAKEDKGIPERTAVTGLKEREAERGQQAVDAEAKKLAEQKKKTEEQQSALDNTRREAEQKKTEPERAAAQEKAAAQEAELAKSKEQQKAAEEKLAAQQEAVQEKQKEVQQEKKDIAADQAAVKIEQKPEEVKKELAQREADVAKREEAVKKGQTDQAIFAGKLYYLKVKEYLSGGHYNNDMLVINAASGAVILKSTESLICGRKFDLFKNGVVVITYKTSHNEGHFLTLLDLDTLQRKAISEQAVFFRSFVETREELTYAVVERGGSYYLGAFSPEMKLLASSRDQVDPDSFVSFYNDLVYINDKNKNILVLNRADLSTKSAITP